MVLEIEDLRVKIKEGGEILKGVDLKVEKGDVVAIMGPNGSGKSTLVNAVMGSDSYEITGGDIRFEGRSIKDLPTHERAKLGIFVSFQNPPDIEGVRYVNFLPMVLMKYHPDDRSTILDLRKKMVGVFERVGLSEDFLNRYLNAGFSGGERKKSEIAQMIFLKPKLAILDEIDSGLDVDALKVISKVIRDLNESGVSFMIITHYPRLLHHIGVSRVYVLMDGEIVAEGDGSLAFEIEEKGYEVVRK